MSSFTKSQSEAIRHVDGPLLVLAGPGSGKTTVVTKRVQYLVQDCSISPSSILVITFTKAAATEMKERFTRLMEQQAQPPGGYGNVSFGTFHAVFFNIFFPAVQNSRIVNGMNSIRFSIHSVVRYLVPSSPYFQIHQFAITSERGFIHISRFSSVRNKIMVV